MCLINLTNNVICIYFIIFVSFIYKQLDTLQNDVKLIKKSLSYGLKNSSELKTELNSVNGNLFF